MPPKNGDAILGLIAEQINYEAYGEGETSVDARGLPGAADAAGPGLLEGSGTPSPLLVYNAITTQSPSDSPIPKTDDYRYLEPKIRQGKRLFSTLQSGLIWNHKQAMRFMTLTSSNESPEDTMRSFNHLVTTIRRTTPARLIEGHYVEVRKVKAYYPGKPVDESLNIEYMAVLTSEGNGVIHALVVGDYLPQRWLSDTWKTIHKAWNVDIRAPRGDTGHQRIARYILAQYVKGQNAIKRINCSQNWIYPGWRADLKKLVAEKKRLYGDEGFKVAIVTWEGLMWTRRRLSDYNRLITLADFGFDSGEALELELRKYSINNYQEWKRNDAMSGR